MLEVDFDPSTSLSHHTELAIGVYCHS